jgi:hypothetical protein
MQPARVHRRTRPAHQSTVNRPLAPLCALELGHRCCLGLLGLGGGSGLRHWEEVKLMDPRGRGSRMNEERQRDKPKVDDSRASGGCGWSSSTLAAQLTCHTDGIIGYITCAFKPPSQGNTHTMLRVSDFRVATTNRQAQAAEGSCTCTCIATVAAAKAATAHRQSPIMSVALGITR